VTAVDCGALCGAHLAGAQGDLQGACGQATGAHLDGAQGVLQGACGQAIGAHLVGAHGMVLQGAWGHGATLEGAQPCGDAYPWGDE
jgi:hypothetical protein